MVTFAVIANYVPENPDELQININECIEIIEEYDDGWAMAKNVDSKEVGLVPRNFLSEQPLEIGAKAITPNPDDKFRGINGTTSLDEVIEEAAAVVAASSSSVLTSSSVGSMLSSSSATSPLDSTPSNMPALQQVTQITDWFRGKFGANGASSTSAPSTNVSSSSSPPSTTVAAAASSSSASAAGKNARINPLAHPPGTLNAPPLAHLTNFQVKTISRLPPTTLISNPNADLNSKVLALTKADAMKKLELVLKKRLARAVRSANIGTMKILVAGDTGIGKTSIIKTFFQMSEVTAADNLPSQPLQSTPAIVDYRCSTIPPNSLITGEDMYNLTFVDTPGFGSQMDAFLTIEPVVAHQVARFQETDKFFEKFDRIQNVVRFVSGGAGNHGHIDVCIYGILHRLKPVDLEYMRRLAPVVNLVPVIFKCDTLNPDEISDLKRGILDELIRQQIKIYGFGMELQELRLLAEHGVMGAVPFAISNHMNNNFGNNVNEFLSLRDALIFNHSSDLRLLTADRFSKWRDARVERDLHAEAREREQNLRAAAATERRLQEERRQREDRDRERERREREERERQLQQQLSGFGIGVNGETSTNHNRSSIESSSVLNYSISQRGSSYGQVPLSSLQTQQLQKQQQQNFPLKSPHSTLKSPHSAPAQGKTSPYGPSSSFSSANSEFAYPARGESSNQASQALLQQQQPPQRAQVQQAPPPVGGVKRGFGIVKK